MSNLLIVVDRNNADRNSLTDLVAAITDAGATVIDVDEPNHLIEAAAPAHLLGVIGSMEGIAYIRSVFNYLCGESVPTAA